MVAATSAFWGGDGQQFDGSNRLRQQEFGFAAGPQSVDRWGGDQNAGRSRSSMRPEYRAALTARVAYIASVGPNVDRGTDRVTQQGYSPPARTAGSARFQAFHGDQYWRPGDDFEEGNGERGFRKVPAANSNLQQDGSDSFDAAPVNSGYNRDGFAI